MYSKTVLQVFATLMLSAATAATASAQTTESTPDTATTQHWKHGWGIPDEQLDIQKSNIVWSVSPATGDLTVTFNLVEAVPTKLYQIGVTFFCTTFPATFGQFPIDPSTINNGNCIPVFLQGVNATVTGVELCVVLTDNVGTGSCKVVVGTVANPIAPGTYTLEFEARDGAGCEVTGGGTNPTCLVDFQSPGPFGNATTIVIP